MSISIHLVSQRRASTDERARVNAQISILESISGRLRSNEPFSDDELEKMKRLARPPEKVSFEDGKGIGWKEVILGRRTEGDGMSEWDRKDMEKVQQEMK